MEKNKVKTTPFPFCVGPEVSFKNRSVKRAALMIVALLLLQSCVSIGLFYSLADDFITWEVDRFLDLTDAQEDYVEQQLAIIIKRHKAEEVPKYERFLEEIKRRLGRELNQADVVWFFAAIDDLTANLAHLFADAATGLLSSLSPAQIKHLEAELAEDNEEWLEEREERSKERPKKRLERIYDSIEEWLGSLTKEQKQRISQLYANRGEGTQIRFQYRLQRQSGFVSILKTAKSKETLKTALLDWTLNSKASASDDYKKYNDSSRARVLKLVALLEQTDTPKQRRYLIDKVDDYLSQLGKLKRP